MPPYKASINIENVVASATLKQNIDLNSVVKAFPSVEYRPEQFPGLVFRLKKPKTATLIFGSGKMVCTGANASASLGGRIDLEKSTYTLGRTMYEPEQFPGLIYRMEEPKVVILLFASGKLVCTGAKKEEEVYESVTKLHARLETDELIYYE
jgi:transcription initiation factor TFIID TATA-box-binding protein